MCVYFTLIIKERGMEKNPSQKQASYAAAKPTPCKNVGSAENGGEFMAQQVQEADYKTWKEK
jgi:hypothetical protein